MSDPDNNSERAGAEFSPEQLDHLEDALERWTSDGADEGSPDLEDSLLAPNIRARLADYRALLALTRDELPMEDVPDALLASVLAEAHASASPQTRPVTRSELVPAGPSLWERLRRSMLLPGFALAGSAALLLWVVQPADEPGLDGAVAERSQGAPARLSQGASPAPAAAEAPTPPAQAAPIREQDGASVVADKDAEEQKAAAPGGSASGATPAPAPPSQAAAADALADDLGEPRDMPKADRTKKASKKAPDPMVESYPGLDDEPMVDGVDKEALRDTLDKADAARRKGGCSEAMRLYIDAMAMSGPNSERARARGGYGLCLSAQGDEDKADKYFDRARELSPAIDAWIKRERGDGPARKAPAKPSAKAKMEAPSEL